MSPDLDARLDRLAGLGEPVRRALYRLVAAAPDAVGREDAAEAVGVARHVAKFHLDRLEADGLLESEYVRPDGRRGPGAGRPAKRYRRAARETAVSLPPRRYDLAGHVMAEALTSAEAAHAPVADALRRTAVAHGRELGRSARAQATGRRAAAARRSAVVDVLAEHGYEPRAIDDGLCLVNCPFHALAAAHQELVCGMNLALIQGVLDGAGATKLTAELDPAPHRCCVRIRQS